MHADSARATRRAVWHLLILAIGLPLVASRGWADYAGTVLGDGAGPYYRLGESGGVVAFDASSRGVNATYFAYNQLTFSQPALIAGDSDTSVFVSEAGVVLPSTPQPIGKTIEGWFTPADAGERALIMQVRNAPNSQIVRRLGIHFTGTFAQEVVTPYPSDVSNLGDTVVVPGTTYHLVGTLADSGDMRLYVNGLQEGPTLLAGSPVAGDYWQIGLSVPGVPNHFDGRMDEVAFYDRVLTPAEILNHYLAGTGQPTLTATATPSITPTPTITATPTITHTLAPVATPTDTATPTATVGCGDGIVENGEQCDDGNLVSGDGCSASCQSELIPGGGSNRTDCTHEWLTAPVTAPNRFGRPGNQLACTDDNPLCDFGPPGDKACTFHVALCFNATEQRFNCTPSDVKQLLLTVPREAHPADAIATGNRDAIETALIGLNGMVRGMCTNSGPRRGQWCETNSDCDATLGSGGGRCTGRFVGFAPPLAMTNRCTTFAEIKVPLRSNGLAVGPTRLRLKATPSSGTADVDVLRLVCKPKL
jgi:cysteine-rich repeat protein